MSEKQQHSPRYQFANAAGDDLICCRHLCEKEATIDVPSCNAYFCEEHYLGLIVEMGCDLKGVAIDHETTEQSRKAER